MIGGMAKGAAMLAPALATMLVVLTTDASLPPADLDAALRTAVSSTFDRLDTDGCMSTNDTVLLLASGAAGTAPDPGDFAELLTEACADLAAALQQDAEGASKAIAIEVTGAASEPDAVAVGRAIARCNLLKCAIAGRGPELGPGAGRHRDDHGCLRARSAGRGDQRSLGLPQRLCGRRQIRGRPAAQGRHHHRRSARRQGRGDDPDQRPDHRVRPRELGLLHVRSPGSSTRASADALAKAATLIEALPWLERFHGQIVVLKLGGHAMTDDALRRAFAQDVVFLRYVGLRPVVVHGGGPQISAQMDKLGMPTTFRAGLRVTTPEAMDVVRMVLTGQVNRDMVGLINQHGPFAVGMSGEDAQLLTASRAQATVDGEPVDLGQVGQIESVNPGAVSALLADGRIPVISSVACGHGGEIYNVNADTAAAALAVALGAVKLVVLTDVPGLYADWRGTGASGEVISEITAGALSALLPGLSDGMIPKMQACLTAVCGGIGQAHVLDGRLPHAVLLEIFTDSGIGTMVVPDEAGRSAANGRNR